MAYHTLPNQPPFDSGSSHSAEQAPVFVSPASVSTLGRRLAVAVAGKKTTYFFILTSPPTEEVTRPSLTASSTSTFKPNHPNTRPNKLQSFNHGHSIAYRHAPVWSYSAFGKGGPRSIRGRVIGRRRLGYFYLSFLFLCPPQGLFIHLPLRCYMPQTSQPAMNRITHSNHRAGIAVTLNTNLNTSIRLNIVGSAAFERSYSNPTCGHSSTWWSIGVHLRWLVSQDSTGMPIPRSLFDSGLRHYGYTKSFCLNM
jgi:hypothetical protein